MTPRGPIGARAGAAIARMHPRFGFEDATISHFKRILVTGGGGFIGSHLVQRLVELGHAVRTLDNFSTGHRSNLEPVAREVEIIEGDIQSYERTSHAARGCEVVFHEAALPSVPRSVQDPLTSNASNVLGTLNMLLAARDAGVQRVIYASSSSVYGSSPAPAKREDMATNPISPYAVAKLAGENYCRSFHVVYGLETVAIRYFNVFGPRQDPRSSYAAVIPRFIAALLAAEPPTIFGDGEQSRDFTYVDNVVDANLLAMDAPVAAGQVYNAACGQTATLNELVTLLLELCRSDMEPIYDAPRPGDVRQSLADISRARADLGYEPGVLLQEGLRRTIDFFRDLSAQATMSYPRK